MDHIAAGDLVRAEMKSGSKLGQEVSSQPLGGGGEIGGRLDGPTPGARRAVEGLNGTCAGFELALDMALRRGMGLAVLMGGMRRVLVRLVADPNPCSFPPPPRHPSQMKEVVNSGSLLPDSMILKVMREHMEHSISRGVSSFLLDGFPRTAQQAGELEGMANVQLALNLSLREEASGALVWGERRGEGRRGARVATGFAGAAGRF